mmetsp:Transcript_12259/g.49393  ORF Transcript_12259/g.49393 Transcript_12259/m.49393 type:complete len:103 (+) Transcript_12259:168-476(+)
MNGHSLLAPTPRSHLITRSPPTKCDHAPRAANRALDATSALLANTLNVLAPYPTEASVAETRKKLEKQDTNTIDPTTGAQYAYYDTPQPVGPRTVDGNVGHH